MRIYLPICLLVTLGAVVGATQAGAGTANVTFVNPEQFSDFKGSGHLGKLERESMMADLKQFIEGEAARSIPAGRSLELRILDIDDAGTTRAAQREVRVSRDLSPAVVNFEFTLREGGKEIASGKEFVAGLAAPVGRTTKQEENMPAIKDALRRWVQTVGQK